MTLEGRPDVFYAGIAPCCAGLYQIVVRVPDGLPDGNHEVRAMVDGVSTPSGPFITVKSPAARRRSPAADAPEGEEPGGSDVVDDDGSGGGNSSGGEGDGDMSGGGGSGGGDTGGGGLYLQIPGAGHRGPTLFPPTSSARGR